MTREERKQYYHEWYWLRGGKEKLSVRRKEVGFYKYGTATNRKVSQAEELG